MNILITGAKGMVGRALCSILKKIRDGKNRTRPNISIEEIYEYDIDNSIEELNAFCEKADFVFNLAGINRPKTNDEFMQGNFGFGERLLNILKEKNNKVPVMLSSSIQATLIGRYGQSDYDGLISVENENGRYCYVPLTYKVTLGEIVDLLQRFKAQPETLVVPSIPDGSFAKKLYSLYLSYLPADRFKFPAICICTNIERP